MLRDAQERFGERDQSYTILGFEFCGDIPQLWYPGNCRHIVIQLTISCLTNLSQACYQLAHECIHLLSPSGGQHANVFEEGLANHFAHRYVQDTFHFDMPVTVPSYQAARSLIEQLLALNSDSVKTIRAKQPTIYRISSGDIRAGCPECARHLADHLAKPFVR